MKIESINNVQHTNSVKKIDPIKADQKDFSQVIKVKEAPAPGVSIAKNANKEMIQDFAEWYFKQGKTYENVKSYKQAINAYERANSVEPDINKSETIANVRNKAYHSK